MQTTPFNGPAVYDGKNLSKRQVLSLEQKRGVMDNNGS